VAVLDEMGEDRRALLQRGLADPVSQAYEIVYLDRLRLAFQSRRPKRPDDHLVRIRS
jgi:hypothetical protein